jgi:long-chain acyl-CoA synthetase
MDVERFERLAEHFDNCPELKRVYVSRSKEEIAHPYVRRMEKVIGSPNDWPSWTRSRCRPSRSSGRRRDDLLHLGHHGQSPRARSATHRAVNSNIFAAAAAGARGFLRRGEAPPQPDPSLPQKGSLISVPFFHATGCFAVMNPSLFGGAKLAMIRKWDPEKAMQLIQDEKLTQMGGVPTIAWQIIEHPSAPELRPVVAGDRGLWRRALGPGTGAQDQGNLAQELARQRLGHDRDLGHRHQQLGRGL